MNERKNGVGGDIDKMAQQPLDLLVIGGGVVGSGIARDAAMRGLRVGAVEQYDFSSGTSSRSSRLLHGGLRYLSQGRVGLVREASLEKKVLHRIAPHVAHPLPFVFPSYKGTPWLLWQLRIGVKFYDLLCSGRNLGKSEGLNKKKVSSEVPGLEQKGLKGAVRYFDGLTNDARLVLDTLRSASKHGAMLQNYCRFERAERTGDLWACQVRNARDGRLCELKTRTIVNAGGPWGDRLPQSRVKLRMTKGVHLVVDRSRLPIPSAIVLPEGKRILFAIPWCERVILGTTDTDYQGRAEDVVCDAADVKYILEVVNIVFPYAKLTPTDIMSTWAGLRPLVANWRGKPSDISRAHVIRPTEPGWWDIAGGKLTTYRLMGEQMVDRVVAFLHKKVIPCRTAVEPILEPSETAGVSGIAPPKVDRSVVEHYCLNEWAEHLQDVMIRRTSWHHYFTDAPNIALQTADWMASVLGWSDARKTQEIAEYNSLCQADRACTKH